MNGPSLSQRDQWWAHFFFDVTNVSFWCVLLAKKMLLCLYIILRSCLRMNITIWMSLLTRTLTISASSSFAFWPSKFWTPTSMRRIQTSSLELHRWYRQCEEERWRRLRQWKEQLKERIRSKWLKFKCFWSHYKSRE